jgi:hypothetical protein
MNDQYSKVLVTKIGGGGNPTDLNLKSLISQRHTEPAPISETKSIFIDTGREGYNGGGEADYMEMDVGGGLQPLDLSTGIAGVLGNTDLPVKDLSKEISKVGGKNDLSGGGGDGLEPLDLFAGSDLESSMDLTTEMGGGGGSEDISIGGGLEPLDLFSGSDLEPFMDLTTEMGGGGVSEDISVGGGFEQSMDLTTEMGGGGVSEDISAGAGLEPAVDLTPSIDLAPALIGGGNETSETRFDSYEMDLSGGGKKDYNDFNFEYTDNVIEDYQKYIEQYENFRSEEKSKGKGKGKYTYSVKDGNMIKTNSSGKELTNLKQPTYINITKIERLLANDIDALLFKLKQQRDEILLTKNLVKLDAFNKIRKEYIELIDFKNKVTEYSESVNRIDENNISLRMLVNNKMESKRKLHEIMSEIKNNNLSKHSVHNACLEYIQTNNINNLDEQIREIKDTVKIDNIITYKDLDTNALPVTEVGEESFDLGIETLNIGDDLDALQPEEDPEEIGFYENKPEIAPEDMDIPLSPITKDKKKKSLKKKLLKIAKPPKAASKAAAKAAAKAAPKAAAKAASKASPKAAAKASQIDATNMAKDGKKKRKVSGVPVKEGKCVFPFKNKDTYVTEEDGCVKGKTGDWCATEVDKDDDYKIKAFGYCN